MLSADEDMEETNPGRLLVRICIIVAIKEIENDIKVL